MENIKSNEMLKAQSVITRYKILVNFLKKEIENNSNSWIDKRPIEDMLEILEESGKNELN